MGAAATAPAVLAVLALVHPGQAVSQLDLNDGGVWLTNTSTLQVGRFSSTVDELNGGLVAASARFDVLQEAGDVLLVEPGTLSVVDPASVTTIATTTVPDDAVVGLGAGTVAVLDPADGSLYAGTVDALESLRTDGAPLADLGAGGAAVVARTGEVLTVAADGTRGTVDVATREVRVEGTGGHGATTRDAAPAPVDAATAVGEALVTLSGSTLRTPSGDDVHLARYGTPLVLQQPGPDADAVLVAGPSALLEVPLDGGDVHELRSGGSGTPAAPVRVGGCVHGAWASAVGSYLTRCEGEDVRTVDLEGMTGADALVFRVNRSVVVLNDTARGRLWVPTEDTELREPSWEAVEPEPEQLEGEPDADTTTSTRTPIAECTTQSAAPSATDDDFGVRPGRATVLPVLDNDAASDCGTLVISEVDPIPATLGTLTVVHGGRALQLEPATGATGSATFTYTVTDGRGSSAPATAAVHVTVRPDGVNARPEQVRRPTLVLELGATGSVDVLPAFRDPDGDELVLLGASADGPATVRSRPDGTVTVTAPGSGALGNTEVTLQVSDGTETVAGVLDVELRPEGSVAPMIDPVHAVTAVDVPVTVRPLDAVRSGTLETARLAGVDPLDGVTVVPDLARGTFTVTAARAGTYDVGFLVAAGSRQSAGVARVDVRARPVDAAAPIAVADRALLLPGAQVTVDPLANDVDPDGGVLVLQSVETPSDSGLRVAVLGHGLLRISATRVLEGPVVLPYVVSDGTASARGQVHVQPVPASATPGAPVVPDVEVTVRAGGVVTIPVLAGAHDPDGQALTLVRDLPEPLPGDQGLLFVSGDVLRYRAPDRPLTVSATFSVEDTDANLTSATVTVTVHAADPALKAPPRPEPVTARVFAGETSRIIIPLLGIDADGDGVTLLGQDRAPTKGRIVDVGADWLEYEAYVDERGTDEFSYAVEDWVGQRAVATVRVGIAERPTDASPIVVEPETVVVQPGRTVEVRVLANDVDPTGAELGLARTLEVPDDVVASIVGRRVVVRAPDRAGPVHVVYTVTTARGAQATGVLTVLVDPDARPLPPSAQDVVVPAAQTVGRAEVEVDVLALAENRNGPLSDLTVAVHDSAAGVARVGGDGQVVVTLGPSAQTLPYVLTDTGSGLSAIAFVTVPARGDFPPVLRPRAPALTVLAGEELVIPLAEQVQVGPGRTARITDEARIQATKSDGSDLSVGPETLRFRAPRTYGGPASISFEVTDAAPGETAPRTRVLTLPITVHPVDDRPPTFRPSTVDVAPGEEAVTVDLTAFTSVPLGRSGAEGLTFVLGAVPAGFVVALDGAQLRVAAPVTAVRGTLGSLGLRVALGDGTPVEGRLELRVAASTRPLARLVDVTVRDGVEGRTSTVDVLDGAFNPFPRQDLTVVGATVETPGAGTASVAGDAVSVRPAADFIGTMVTRYTVRDATGDPAREVEGRVTVAVRGRPGTPVAPRVTEVRDRAVVLAWDAPVAHGEPITGYRVTASPGGLVRECAGTTCTVDGLTNDTEYTFTVAARNAVDWSPPSAASAAVRPDAQPDAPAAAQVVPGDRQLTVSWTAPRSPGSPVDHYTVEVSPAPSAGASFTTTGTSATVRGLTNGVEYTVRVRAHNRAPEPGAWSPWSAGAVPAAAPDAPAPTAARHDTGPAGVGRLDVGWPAVADNGAAVTEYEVAVDGTSVALLPASTTAWAFDGAERGRTYTITVRARNAAGWSGWGSTPGETWSAPSEPRDATAADAGGTEVPWGRGSVVLTWQPPADTGGTGLTVTGYEVEGLGRTAATSWTVGDLTAGSSPTYRVRAWSSRDEASAWVTIAPTTVTTAPAAPSGLDLTAVGHDRVHLAWTAGSTGGSAVTGFRYRIDDGAWVEVGPGVTSAEAGRSAAGAAVVVDVAARNALGWSPATRATLAATAPAGSGTSSGATP